MIRYSVDAALGNVLGSVPRCSDLTCGLVTQGLSSNPIPVTIKGANGKPPHKTNFLEKLRFLSLASTPLEIEYATQQYTA